MAPCPVHLHQERSLLASLVCSAAIVPGSVRAGDTQSASPGHARGSGHRRHRVHQERGTASSGLPQVTHPRLLWGALRERQGPGHSPGAARSRPGPAVRVSHLFSLCRGRLRDAGPGQGRGPEGAPPPLATRRAAGRRPVHVPRRPRDVSST